MKLRRSYRPLLLVSLVLVCSLSVFADDKPATVRELSFDQLEVGQRIRLTRTSGSVFTGTVTLLTRDALRLDLSDEPDGLNAWIGFRASIIKKIELLTPVPAETVQAVHKQRQDEAQKALQQVRARTDTPEEPGRKTDERPVLSDRQIMLLRTFPPDQWGNERLAEIRRRWVLMGLPPDAAESDFVRFYPEWEIARTQLESLRQWELDHRDVVLLETFPPSEGWSPRKRDLLAARLAAGAQLTAPEATFLQVYDDWFKAYQEHMKSTEPAKPAEGTPAETPAPEVPPEKPAPAPPAEPPAPAPPQEPAQTAPVPENPEPPPAPVPDAPDAAPAK